MSLRPTPSAGSGRRSRAARGLAAATALALGAAALAATAGSANAATRPAVPRHTYANSVAPFVKTAPDVGTPPAPTTVEGEVYLPLKDEIGAQRFATAVSTPGNPAYGTYLSPAAWISKYSPSRVDLAAVEQYLTDSGLTVFAVPTSRQYIVFRGPSAKMAAAFGTTLRTYRVAGTTVTAAATPPSLLESIASKVLAVDLGDARARLTHPMNVRPGVGTGSSAPATATPRSSRVSPNATTSNACSSYWDENEAVLPKAYGRTRFPTFICGYLPGQLRSAGGLNKGINSGYDGTGQTLAIVDAYASPTILRDTNDYMRTVGSPLLLKFQDISGPASQFNDEDAKICGGPSAWQAEEAIDVQSAHSVSPGANILYSGGFNCGGGLDIALSKILDRGLASIVSNSYGNYGEAVPDGVLMGEQNIHLQAAGEGIGLYFSSGDSGDESVNLGYTSPDFPASSPYVTAVGGTSEAIAANGSYLFETGWEDILAQVKNGAYTAPPPGNLYGGGAGGGVSTNFAEPAYQKGVVPTSLATSADGTPGRVVPDIADLADPYTGFQIAIRPILDNATLKTGALTFETYGGTSLASPIAAAKAALVQDQTGRTIGFANPAIYALNRAVPSGFHDVVPPAQPTAVAYTSARSGNQYLVTFNQGLSLFTAKGYDTETGVGSLKVPQLVAFLNR